MGEISAKPCLGCGGPTDGVVCARCDFAGDSMLEFALKAEREKTAALEAELAAMRALDAANTEAARARGAKFAEALMGKQVEVAKLEAKVSELTASLCCGGCGTLQYDLDRGGCWKCDEAAMLICDHGGCAAVLEDRSSRYCPTHRGGPDVAPFVRCQTCGEPGACAHSTNPVTKPAHYQGKVEAIDGIESAVEGLAGADAFNAGQVLKYVWRHHRKGKPLEDLRKARWYLDRLIAAQEPKP